MLLGELIKNIKPAYKSIKFNNIRFNSKDCKTNDIFFSIQGNKLKGNNYIKDAIKNGSKIIISNLNFDEKNCSASDQTICERPLPCKNTIVSLFVSIPWPESDA